MVTAKVARLAAGLSLLRDPDGNLRSTNPDGAREEQPTPLKGRWLNHPVSVLLTSDKDSSIFISFSLCSEKSTGRSREQSVGVLLRVGIA